MSDLHAKLSDLARTPVLLVASDYDGTLSPIVDDPSKALPNREALVAVRALSMMSQTHVAVISGRSLRDLAALTGLTEDVHLVGSHGSEFDPDFARRLPDGLVELREQLREELEAIAETGEGFQIEDKPAGVAFHYRRADDRAAAAVVESVLQGPARRPGVHLKHGKKVIELGVVPGDKGTALADLRHRVGATACLFLGDDQSDEDAFATLCGPDIGIKIGAEASRPSFGCRTPWKPLESSPR